MLRTCTALTPTKFLEITEQFLLKDYHRTLTFLRLVDPEVLEIISRKKALKIFKQAANNTPAYQAFLKRKKIDPKKIRTTKAFENFIPPTDKNNYIKKYSFEKRCHGGKLPTTGNVDESGGTSGIATNWIHDINEESLLYKAVKFEFNYMFKEGSKEYFVLSAWSTGPWATGVKFCELMEKLALVKNTASDPKDILNTLEMFGTKRNYLIGGYPPFVKNLIDDYAGQINWKKYKIDLIVGGEGVTLDWVNHVRKRLRKGAKIVSSYGASDIDIGVGFESPLCYKIRELAGKNKELRIALFGKDDLPMIFQYNPTMHYIQETVNEHGQHEFEITLLDSTAAIPKIKYNLHDEGLRFKYKELIKIVNKHVPGFKKSVKNDPLALHLPFLIVFGRSDGTLSFDGANVYPHQIEEAILETKELAKAVNRFKIEKRHDSQHNTEFHVHLELKKRPSKQLQKRAQQAIHTKLLSINPDYKESYSKNKRLMPKIDMHHLNEKLFSDDDKKVKNIYIMKS